MHSRLLARKTQVVSIKNNTDGARRGSINVYLDTEFSSLSAPELLSVGLVTDDGQECYVEIEAIRAQVNAFVRRTVLPQWGCMASSAASAAQLGNRVDTWLLTLGRGSINVVHDYETDFLLLREALRAAGVWDRWSDVLVPFKVGYLVGQPISDEAMDLSWTDSWRHDGIHRHHALADAHALQAGYLAQQGISFVRHDPPKLVGKGHFAPAVVAKVAESDARIPSSRQSALTHSIEARASYEPRAQRPETFSILTRK